MDCLVTGGAGFIGSNLVRALIADGKSVRVLDNFETGRRGNLDDILADIELMEADIRDAAAVERAVRGVGSVFHLAALPSVARSVGDPVATNEVNVHGTVGLLAAARDAGVARFVFASSSSAYGNTPVLPKREDMKPEPRSPYAVQKLTGEYYCGIFHALYGLQTYSLRFFNVYGPRQNPESQYAAVIPAFIKAFVNGRSPVIHGDGMQTRDFSFVEDVVGASRACCDASEKAAGGVFNIAGGKRISINELAERLGALVGGRTVPVHTEPREGDVRDSLADVTRASELLGWKPSVSFEEGLRRTAEWFVRFE